MSVFRDSTGIFNLLSSSYDMYSADSRAMSMAVADDGQGAQETQPALEVIELANGETVWYVCPLIKVSFLNQNGLQECHQWSERC